MEYKSKRRISLLVLEQGRLAAIILALFRLATGIALPLTAYVFQELIDEIISSFQANNAGMTMIGSLFMISGIYVFQAVEEPVEGYCDFLLRQRLNYWFDSNNIEKISRLEYSHFENSGDLDLINRMDGSAGNAAVDLYENIMDLISGVIKIAGTFILLLNYNIIVSVVVVLLAVPIMFIASKYGKEIHAWYQKNSKSRRRLEYFSSVFTDRTTSLELKEYNHYEYLKSTLSEQFKDLRMKDFKLQMKAWKNTILSGLLLNLGIA